ncbi:hypothetical protein TNCV_863901 [Trichonephila clavipes]|nr:hypothetical protein TNCV_863901 [Trichonephila clavipes]
MKWGRCLGTQNVLLDRGSEAYAEEDLWSVSIMVTCDPPPQYNELLQFTGRYCTPHHHRSPSMFHGWNQAVNMKCFCRRSTDENTSGGQE